MDSGGRILPCRVVPFHGPGEIRVVGPPNSPCYAGAWSGDGRWIYLTVTTGESHIWRQRFRSGELQQITFGPTSQEGIGMAPDGKSFITSVGSQDSTVWIHDKDGDHQISSEGNARAPSFSSDGNSLYFLMINRQSHLSELLMKDLKSGKMDRLLPGYSMEHYSISHDGKQIAFTANDAAGYSSIWNDAAGHPSMDCTHEPAFVPGAHLLDKSRRFSSFLARWRSCSSRGRGRFEFSLPHES